MKTKTLQTALYRVASVYINNAPNRFAVITGRWGEPALATFDTEAPAVKLADRLNRLMPAGVPRYVRCYDNGGETADRYTVCFTGRAGSNDGEYSYRAMSAYPFHPQGVGMWGASKGSHCDVNKHGFAPAIGRKCHLGRRIAFSELPEDCRKLVLRDYKEIWNLNP